MIKSNSLDTFKWVLWPYYQCKKKKVYNCMDQEELTPVGIKTSKQQQQKNCEHLTSVFAPYRSN